MLTKRKIATKLRSKKELLSKISVFQTKGWLDRKKAIAERVSRKKK